MAKSGPCKNQLEPSDLPQGWVIKKGVNVNLGLKVNIDFNFLCRRVHIRVRLLLGFISLWLKNDGEKSKQKIILQCYKTKFKTYTNTLLVFWTTQSRTTLPYINITYLTKANSLLSSKEWIRFECCLISSWGVEILNQTLLYNYLWTAPTIFSMT